MKRKFVYVLLTLSLLTGCANKGTSQSNNANNEEINIAENINKEENIQEEQITVFHSIGNTYEENKDILAFNEGDMIYDLLGGNAHVRGEYKEIDFAADLIREYLFKNGDVYNYIVSEWDDSSDEVVLISGDDKQRTIDSANFLGEQFGLSDDAPVYFRLDKVILQEKYENGVSLEMRGHLSATDGNYRPLGTFTVDVYKKGDTLYATII